jgi:hypothetical protein
MCNICYIALTAKSYCTNRKVRLDQVRILPRIKEFSQLLGDLDKTVSMKRTAGRDAED